MTAPPAPYAGATTPFSIGLRPLDVATWIEPGDDLAVRLAEKARLLATVPEAIFVEEDGTREAQAEVRAMLEANCLAHHPDHWRQSPEGVAPDFGNAPDKDLPPLLAASLIVQEDLILMRRGQDGWRLAAGALFFPSSWILREKFGRPMHAIHAPVPGFGAGTRMAAMIERIFDNLKPGLPAERFNWSIQSGTALHMPVPHGVRGGSRFADGEIAAKAAIRIERQTLHRMPVSGDILFTIRIHLDPFSALAMRPDRAILAPALARQLAGLDEAQIVYKGLLADRAQLLETLAAIASSGV